MKSPGRKRKAVGYTLLTLALLTAAAWAQSRWYYRGFETTHFGCSLVRGVCTVNFATGPTPTAATRPGETPFRGVGVVSFSLEGGPLRWDWKLHDQTPAWFSPSPMPSDVRSFFSLACTYSTTSFPWMIPTPTGPTNSLGGAPIRTFAFVLWPVPVAFLTAGLWFTRSGRRAAVRAKGRCCPACGYSLAGLGLSAPCPECGKRAAATTT